MRTLQDIFATWCNHVIVEEEYFYHVIHTDSSDFSTPVSTLYWSWRESYSVESIWSSRKICWPALRDSFFIRTMRPLACGRMMTDWCATTRSRRISARSARKNSCTVKCRPLLDGIRHFEREKWYYSCCFDGWSRLCPTCVVAIIAWKFACSVFCDRGTYPKWPHWPDLEAVAWLPYKKGPCTISYPVNRGSCRAALPALTSLWQTHYCYGLLSLLIP